MKDGDVNEGNQMEDGEEGEEEREAVEGGREGQREEEGEEDVEAVWQGEALRGDFDSVSLERTSAFLSNPWEAMTMASSPML